MQHQPPTAATRIPSADDDRDHHRVRERGLALRAAAACRLAPLPRTGWRDPDDPRLPRYGPSDPVSAAELLAWVDTTDHMRMLGHDVRDLVPARIRRAWPRLGAEVRALQRLRAEQEAA